MEFAHLKKFNSLLPKIPRKKGVEVVTRFPPEPSGYLHLGHLKAILLNYALAKKYDGRCLLRFDDTNPDNISTEYEQAIREDLEAIGFKPDGDITYSSDYFGQLLEVADQLVATGDAYVDETPAEDIKALRRMGMASHYRNRPNDAHVIAWQWMKEGKLPNACLRLKTKMDHHNPTMRDPVIYRRSPTGTEHPRWLYGPQVFPTYDFVCPLIDSWEGVTHALRSNEYFQRDDIYKWILKKCGRDPIHLTEFSRLTLSRTLMSKRKLKQVVAEGRVAGWDDPRLPTLRGLMARGAMPEAMIKFVADQGLANNSVVLDWDKLWAFNKQILDLKVPRYTCLESEPGQLCVLHLREMNWRGAPIVVPRHPRIEEMGNKDLGLAAMPCAFVTERYGGEFSVWLEEDDASRLREGDEVTLLYWGNVIIDKILTDDSCKDKLCRTDRAQPERVLELWGRHRPEGDAKSTAWKLTWLPQAGFQSGKDLVQGWIHRYRYLLSTNQLPDGEDWREYWDDGNFEKVPIICEPSVLEFPDDQTEGSQIQFQRKGFYRRIRDDPVDGRPCWVEHIYFTKKR